MVDLHSSHIEQSWFIATPLLCSRASNGYIPTTAATASRFPRVGMSTHAACPAPCTTKKIFEVWYLRSATWYFQKCWMCFPSPTERWGAWGKCLEFSRSVRALLGTTVLLNNLSKVLCFACWILFIYIWIVFWCESTWMRVVHLFVIYKRHRRCQIKWALSHWGTLAIPVQTLELESPVWIFDANYITKCCI